MLRRQAVSLLLGSAVRISAKGSGALDRFVDPARGCALLVDVHSRRVIASNGNPLSESILVPPGSTLKPFVLSALLSSGKITPDESFVCPQRLSLASHRMDCSHPQIAVPIRIDTALAYSCNCFVAHAAERFAPGELARVLQRFGRATPQLDSERQRLQALGTAGILVTPSGLAQAYGQLANQLARDEKSRILAGLDGAVDYGTGQLARVGWAKLAGKTGSARDAENFIAWFAGFVPSRAPEVVVTVMLSGRHGGSDAAPAAAQILDAWHAGL